MRILSLNTWNAATDRDLRSKQLLHTLSQDDTISIVCLQGIDDRWECEVRAALPDYAVHRLNNLMIASKFPIHQTAALTVHGETTVQLVHIKGRVDGVCANIAIANLHMPRSDDDDRIVASALRKLNRISHSDTIITGNFNRGAIDVPPGWEAAVHMPTWPSWKAPRQSVQYDWSLLRLNTYELDNAHVMRGLYVSDHLATLIELK